MNKIAKISAALAIILLSGSCLKKDFVRNSEILGSRAQSNFSVDALNFLNSTLDQHEKEKLDITHGFVMKMDGVEKFYIVKAKDPRSTLYILLVKEGADFKGFRNVVEYSQNGQVAVFSSETLDKSSGSEVTFKNEKVLRLIKRLRGKIISKQNFASSNQVFKTTSNNVVIGDGPVTASSETDPTTQTNLPPVTFTKYVSSAPNYYYSLYFATNQSSSYYYSYVPVACGGCSASSGAPGATNVVIINPPTRPVDVSAELKCITAKIGSTYKLSISINQPNPTHRDAVAPLSIHPVGHSWITLEQRDANGNIIRRSVGFYPSSQTSPKVPNAPSQYQDDSYSTYSVSMTIPINAAQSQTVKNYLIAQTQNYDINSYNCTNVAVGAFSSIGVNLPQTVRTIYGSTYSCPECPVVPIFVGLDPGDLGEDIRNLNETTFGSQLPAANRPVVIERLAGNTGAKGKLGSCPF